MVRPSRITVNNGDNSWESQLNTNLQQIYDLPIPILLHAGTLANLETTRPAAQYQWCMAIVDYDSAGTPGEHMAFSNGTAWKLASNWEFFNRKTYRAISGAVTLGDTDDVLVITGASTFDLTLSAIADANEGRVVHIKHNGTGTVTVKTTGGDTIDGAATLVMDSQYSSTILSSDGTSDWHVLATSGGAATFLDLADTPANFTGDALKAVTVNAAEDALEFTELVNVIGLGLKHMARARTSGTEALSASPGGPMDLPTEISSHGTAVTWHAVNKEFEINESGNYLVLSHGQTTSASAHNPFAHVSIDTGGGYAAILGASSSNSNGIRQSMPTMLVHTLSAGDTLQLWMFSSGTVNSREGTHMSVIKMEGSIAGGGDMEVHERSLTGSNFVLTATPTGVDMPIEEENNATDLYTWSTGNDDLTVNEAGMYLIYGGVVFEEAGADIDAVVALQISPLGGGFVTESATQRSVQATVGTDTNMPATFSCVRYLNATDVIRMAAWEVDGAVEVRVGCNFGIVRLKRGSDAIDYEEDVAVDTGRKWIDGKTIWRKVITSSGALSTGFTGIAHSITGLDKMVNLEGFATRDDGAVQRVPINYAHTAAGNLVSGYVDNTNIGLLLGTSWTGAGNVLSDPQITLEYTIT